MSLRYIVTTHVGMDGVGLSRPGHWGGVRFPDSAAADAAARKDAAGRPFVIDRETRRLRGPRCA